MRMRAAPSQATPDQWFGDASERRTEGRCSQELRGMGACRKQLRLWGQSEDVSFAGRAMA